MGRPIFKNYTAALNHAPEYDALCTGLLLTIMRVFNRHCGLVLVHLYLCGKLKCPPCRCPRQGCSFMATRQDTIENHVAYKHENATMPFKCKFPRCLRAQKGQYKHRASLIAHMNKVHPKKPRERNNNFVRSVLPGTLSLKGMIKQGCVRQSSLSDLNSDLGRI